MQMVLNDPNDTGMQDALRASFEDANSSEVQTQEQCLDYIASYGGPIASYSRPDRLRWAREVLQNDMLPHVSINEGDEYKKAYFTGYMINRLLLAYLGRSSEDDRDYYGKKRLDMAGALLKMIFRQ